MKWCTGRLSPAPVHVQQSPAIRIVWNIPLLQWIGYVSICSTSLSPHFLTRAYSSGRGGTGANVPSCGGCVVADPTAAYGRQHVLWATHFEVSQIFTNSTLPTALWGWGNWNPDTSSRVLVNSFWRQVGFIKWAPLFFSYLWYLFCCSGSKKGCWVLHSKV